LRFRRSLNLRREIRLGIERSVRGGRGSRGCTCDRFLLRRRLGRRSTSNSGIVALRFVGIDRFYRRRTVRRIR
jgi:hypothetical protein